MRKNNTINIFKIGYIVFAILFVVNTALALAVDGVQTFQYGVKGYRGTDDAIITNLFVQDTDGNGVSARDGYLRAFQQFYEARTLIRFKDISLPAGAELIRAELKLVVTDRSGGMILGGYYLDKSWDIESESLGWKNRKLDKAWSDPGALNDVIHGKSFIINGFSGEGVQQKIVPLDNEVVLNWLNNPSTNNGLLIVMLDKDASAWIHSSEDPEVSYRPQLILYYE
ncbi:conserved hypothetical protein, secreted [Candidatus Magnetomorum sp. HK-1]|nr:conserved hypothetical protein, secreted [Candidatus Magnetomorum sp. HK-1]